MFKKSTLYPLIISLGVVYPVFAEEATEDGVEIQKFYDTERLIATLTADDKAALDAATADVEAATAAEAVANKALDDAIAAQTTLPGDATDEQIADAQRAVDEAVTTLNDATTALGEATTASETAQNDVQGEIDETTTLVGELSEEQLFALNRSLNNAADGKLLVDIDAEDLQKVIDGDYNKLQINAFTQAFEQEARFQLKADKFTAKYEETGNEKFLDHSVRMEEKGVNQKTKFEAKIDRFSESPSSNAGKLAKQEAKSAAKDSAKGAAKSAAKQAAKQAAKSAAKGAAKSAAKQSAKAAAKRAARNI